MTHLLKPAPKKPANVKAMVIDLSKPRAQCACGQELPQKYLYPANELNRVKLTLNYTCSCGIYYPEGVVINMFNPAPASTSEPMIVWRRGFEQKTP
jgi:hypothetical protein